MAWGKKTVPVSGCFCVSCCLMCVRNRVVFTVVEFYYSFAFEHCSQCLQYAAASSTPLSALISTLSCLWVLCLDVTSTTVRYNVAFVYVSSLHQTFLTEGDRLKWQFSLCVMWLMRQCWKAPEWSSAKHSGWLHSECSDRCNGKTQIYLSERRPAVESSC